MSFLISKSRLLFGIGVCVLLIATGFSGVAIELQEGVQEGMIPQDHRIYIPRDNDWNYWANAPDMYTIPSGNVGIGTSNPLAKLHLMEGAFLCNGTFGSTPVSGGGTRLMWIPEKAAFRAGYVHGNQWDPGQIGVRSVAMGSNTVASGNYGSVALGYSTEASGIYGATAIGSSTVAAGRSSTALGLGSEAHGDYSMALGNSIAVVGQHSVGIGLDENPYVVMPANVLSIIGGDVGIGTTEPMARLAVDDGAVLFDGVNGNTPTSGAGTRLMWIPAKGAIRAGSVTGGYWDDGNIGGDSTAFGEDTKASGGRSTALGYRSTASGTGSLATGSQTTASGFYATAIGSSINVDGLYSVGIGLDDSEWPYPTVSNDNVMSIMGGNVGIGTIDPNNPLEVNGTIHSTSGGFKFPDGSTQTTASTADVWSQNGNDIYYNDGNVGIGTTSPNSKLSVEGEIEVNGSRLCVGSSGNVGIGTSSPGEKLEVLGNVTVSGEDNSEKMIKIAQYENGSRFHTIKSISSGSRGLEFLTAYDGQILLNPDGTGNVGIGTTYATNKLSVNGGADFAGAVGVGFSDPGTATLAVDGDVGIGLSDPNQVLHIDKSSGDVAIQLMSGMGQGSSPGNYFPDVGVNDASIGTEPWIDPQNVTDIGNYTNVTLSYSISNYLKATDFDFYIPSDVYIAGIQVYWKKLKTGDGGPIYDYSVKLVKNGMVYGENRTSSEQWPTVAGLRGYGDSSDLWGGTWTPADINSPDFGVAISATSSYGTSIANIGYAKINVYYVDPVWTMGCDESDFDIFKIACASSLGGSYDYLTIDSRSGDVNISEDISVNGIANMNSDIFVNGNIGIGTLSPLTKFHVAGAVTDDFIGFFENDGTYANGLLIQTGGMANSDYALKVQSNDGSTESMVVTNAGRVGIGTTDPEEKLTVRGNLLIERESDGDNLIEFGEGLDYSEGFDVSDSDEIEPGTVLIIDPENPGKLTVSTNPYDTKVAGIVAGANGLGSAIKVGSEQFDLDVALAGRVYCNVDATEEGIEPGDILTTSSTPGFAMKATDYDLAQGAILGKAMESLEEGTTGQILVLVTLQ